MRESDNVGVVVEAGDIGEAVVMGSSVERREKYLAELINYFADSQIAQDLRLALLPPQENIRRD
jgi:hypothetical protein